MVYKHVLFDMPAQMRVILKYLNLGLFTAEK